MVTSSANWRGWDIDLCFGDGRRRREIGDMCCRIKRHNLPWPAEPMRQSRDLKRDLPRPTQSFELCAATQRNKPLRYCGG